VIIIIENLMLNRKIFFLVVFSSFALILIIFTGQVDAAACVNGPIPGNGACECGGGTYNTGNCCDNVYSSSTSCNTTAPQCSEGSVPSSGCLCSGYAYTSGYCCKTSLQSGLVWAGNTPCTQTCPTIAKSVSSSYSGVCCGGSVSDCKGAWSGQWATDCQGYVCCIGTAQPLCTGTAYGEGAPSPSPSPSPSPTTTTSGIPGAGAPEPTNDDAGVWAQVDISTGQIAGSSICTRSVCGLNGEYHGYVPPSSFATGSVWWPTSKRYIWQIAGQAGYSSGSFNFNTYIFTVSGGTIYNGKFTPTPTTNTTSTITQNVTTASSTPMPALSPITTSNITTPSILPTPTPIKEQRPLKECNTDQDCSWLSTNSCPENAGASWACRSLLEDLPHESATQTCPQVLSTRPSANCGCVQNKCLVYENKKPVELPKKIGNTSIDAGVLLSAVIQMEQLKVKFEFLKSATTKLSLYYNLTGNLKSSEIWLKVSSKLEVGIEKVESLKNDIRDKLETLTIEDLRKLKSEVKSIRGILKEVLKTALEA